MRPAILAAAQQTHRILTVKFFFTSKKKLAVGQYLPVHVDDVLDYDLIGSAL